MATRNDVITSALRFIGVVADDEPATAEQLAVATSVLTGILTEAEIEGPTGMVPADDVIEDRSADALAEFLGASLAPRYGKPSPVGRPAAARRFWSTVRADSRTAVDAREDRYF